MIATKHLIILSFSALVHNVASSSIPKINAKNSTQQQQQQQQFAILQGTSILFGLTTVSNGKVISTECHDQLHKVQSGVLQKEPWAMKMYDASGSPTSGFIYGNNYWFGSRETCDALKHTVKLKISKYVPHKMNSKILSDTPPFATDYRVVYLQHNSTWQMDAEHFFYDQMVHIGLCLPSVCNSHEIEWLMSQYLQDESFAQKDIYNMQLQVAYVKELKLRTDVFNRPSFYMITAFCLFTFVMMWAAARLRASTADTTLSNGDAVATRKDTQAREMTPLARFISCYDATANWPKCFGDAQRNREYSFLPALGGLQFACALGVTLFHALTCNYFTIANKLTVYQYGNDIGNFNIFVDVFFTISGILQGYYFHNTQRLEMIRRNNGWQNLKLFGQICMHRLLRIAPMLWYTICLGDVSSRIVDDISSFHWPYRMYEKCEQYWWRNLFFIQNLFPHADLCAFWSWSLACDMQFFLLTILLLFLYAKRPRAAKIAIIGILLANILYTYLVGMKINFQISLESSFVHFTAIYMNPLSRILAYGFGALTGWWLAAQRQRLVAHKHLLEQFGYVAIFVFFACIFTPVAHEHSVLYSLTLLLLQRLLFSLSACVVLVANACGCLTLFFRIFESAAISKFSKISYALSLLNPMLLGALAGLSTVAVHMNLWTMIIEYLGAVTALIGLAILHTFLFDIPYRNMTALLLKKKSKET